ncbi:MAG: sulfatase, partial [Myxococcales bacterium]|nr:sulfatase [Myxococcales bacterium]
DMILITIDTLRWDHLGFAGYSRSDISPHIDALAARSVVAENAYSISAKTPTAVPPMLASRWPSEMPRSDQHFVRYRNSNLYVAEVMAEAGYHTAASVAHWYFRPSYGFADGFEDWREYWRSGDQMERIPTSEQVADNAIAILDEFYRAREAGESDEPLFLWVHFFDPHKLYIEHDGIPSYGNTDVDLYDGEIRFTDLHLGRVLQTVRDWGFEEDTVVVLTADHGEAFGEHDMEYHGWDLYEHQIRVPLVAHVPGVEPRRVEERLSIVDIAPTLVDLAGADVPESFRGTSWVPWLESGREPTQRAIFTEMPAGPYNTPKRSLTLGDWKLIHHPNGRLYRLFNLAEDPGELNDLWESEPEQAQRMRDLYEAFLATRVDAVAPD